MSKTEVCQGCGAKLITDAERERGYCTRCWAELLNSPRGKAGQGNKAGKPVSAEGDIVPQHVSIEFKGPNRNRVCSRIPDTMLEAVQSKIQSRETSARTESEYIRQLIEADLRAWLNAHR